jgi:putative ABC transport system ATP-binding protein
MAETTPGGLGSNGSAKAAIATQALTRHYRMGGAEVKAVDGVSVRVETGEFLALLGASGSGKSTLLNMIAGLDSPTAGSVAVNGMELGKLSRNELARYRLKTVGMVFQSFNLIPAMSLLENVELPMRFAEVDRAARRELSHEALGRVGLSARAAHRPKELSGGEQQRAAIARALINKPSLLLADEPTGNLDSRTGADIMNLLAELNAQGMTVLMVTHERQLALRYARRLLTMADGKLVDDSPNTPARTDS